MFLLRTHHWNPVYIIALIKISGVVCTIIKVACYSTLWLSLQRGVYSILRMHPTTWCDNEKTFGMQCLSIITKRMTFESCLSPFSFPHPLEIEHMLLSLPHRGSSWPYLNCPFHQLQFLCTLPQFWHFQPAILLLSSEGKQKTDVYIHTFPLSTRQCHNHSISLAPSATPFSQVLIIQYVFWPKLSHSRKAAVHWKTRQN